MTKRFKQLDLIDRLPEELWMEEVHDIVQEAVMIKTIPPKKEMQKGKWLSEEALQIAEKRREAKGKGEKERYTHSIVFLYFFALIAEEGFLISPLEERTSELCIQMGISFLFSFAFCFSSFHSYL